MKFNPSIMKRHAHFSDLYFWNTGRLRTVLLSLAFTLGLALSFAIAKANATPTSFDQPYRTERFSVSGNVSLDVETSGGSIEVTGSKSNEVVVEMYVRKRGRLLNLGDIDLDDYEITIEQRGNQVVAHAERKRKFNWGGNNDISISFKVKAPASTSSELSTSGGSIDVALLNGSQNLNTSGGSISVADVMGNVEARTSGGSIHVENMEGDLDAKTSGGSISLDNVKGDLDFSTSGGSLDLDAIAGKVRGSTSGGSIHADITEVTGDIELSTSGGSIYATVPGNRGYNLELRGNSVDTKLENFSGTAEDDRISGQMNGGGPEIKLRTSGGRIRLKYT
jgi:hypothetical protein